MRYFRLEGADIGGGRENALAVRAVTRSVTPNHPLYCSLWLTT